MHRLEREHANLRASLSWAAAGGEGETELRLAVALARFWRSRGYRREGRRRLEGALSRFLEAPLALRAKARDGAGFFAQQLGEYGRAAALHEEALALARSIGDEQRIAEVLNNLGALAIHQDDYERATAVLEEGLAICRGRMDRWTAALTLYKLGRVARLQSADGRAAALLREGLALFRELGAKRSVAVTLSTLAAVPGAGGEGGAARRTVRALLEESLALCRELGDRGATELAIETTAQATARQAEPERIARLLGAAEGLRDHVGLSRLPDVAAGIARAETVVCAALGEQAYAAALAEGRALSVDDTVALALAVIGSAMPADGAPAEPVAMRAVDSLSRREREVLGLLAEGRTNREIARELSIAERTAKFHVTSILNKLGASTRGQAVALAVRRGLL